MRILSLLFAVLFAFASCDFFQDKDKGDKKNYSENRLRMESEAQQRLEVARQLLAEKKCSQAKQTVENMRKDCYLAIDARKEGLLLMDSIDLCISRQELADIDSLMCAGNKTVTQDDFDEACRKVQFYERKIHFDKKRQREEKAK